MDTVKNDRQCVSPDASGWRLSCLALALFVLLGFLLFGVGPSYATTRLDQGQPRLAFWIATNNNSIFDDQTVRFITNNADIVVLNAPLASNDGSLGYTEIVARLHKENARLPVLLYFWATRVYTGKTYHGVQRSGSVVSKDLPGKHDLLLKNPKTGNTMRSARVSYGDVTSATYRNWLINQVLGILQQTGADGVASDGAQRRPFPQWCARDSSFCEHYEAGVDTLFADLKEAIAPKKLIFNGLWANKPGRLERQEKLLDDTDGTVIEWFGRRQNKPIPPFQTGLQPYLQAIQRHPDKTFLVFARGATAYSNYRDDYLWQRYLYAAYLMVARPNTSFRYLATFQSESPGRASMFSLYDDMAMKIGSPKERYRMQGDLYVRKFSNGLALFVPKGGEPETYTLSRTLYDPDGKSYSGRIRVDSGDGLVLYDERPGPHSFKLPFSDDIPKKASLPASDIVTSEGGTPFLSMQALPERSIWRHDIMLNPIKALRPSLDLKIQLRTRDPAAALYAVAEVDDKAKKAVQAVSILPAGTCPERLKPALRISFREPHARLGHPQGCRAHFLNADGKWHTYTIPSTGVLLPRLTVRRWEYLRFSGAVDVAYISQPG